MSVLILFSLFEIKVIPSMREKNMQIEILVNELNKMNHKGHKQLIPEAENSRKNIKNQFITI